MLLDAEVTQYVAIAGVAVGVLGSGVAFGTARRLRRLRKAYAAVSRSAESGGILEDIAGLTEQTEALRLEAGHLRREVRQVQTELGDAIRHVAVVRYDAFDDMGGRLSFSAAMLDDSGDGLVLTAIHSRGETRSYAKGIKGAASSLPLSEEEQQAIAYATRAAAQRAAARPVASAGTGES